MTARQPKSETPTPEQLANGDYARRFVMHAESATETMAYISRADPVERWSAVGRLSDTQRAAIDLVRALWGKTEMPQKVTASYGERMQGGSAEGRAAVEIDARRDLHRIMDYIPAAYWHVFEMVCRYEEAAGVAGSRLGFGDRSARDRAHTIVCFVADIIAMKERL